MKFTLAEIFSALVLVALLGIILGAIVQNVIHARRDRSWPVFCNIAEGTHCEAFTRAADAAIATLYLLAKEGATPGTTAALCGAANVPIGSFHEIADAAGDLVTIKMLGATNNTRKLIASGVIAVRALIFTDANGKVQAEPAGAGTYYCIGRTLTAAGADGDVIEAETWQPIRFVVLAALTSTDGTAAGAADLAALKAETEKLGDDVRAIAGALSTATFVKVLAA